MPTVIALSKHTLSQIWNTEAIGSIADHDALPVPKLPPIRPLSIADLSGYMDHFAAMEMRSQMAGAPLTQLRFPSE